MTLDATADIYSHPTLTITSPNVSHRTLFASANQAFFVQACLKGTVTAGVVKFAGVSITHQ